YGAGFHSAVPVLATLIVIIPIMMVSGHYRYLLVAAGQQKWLMRWSLLAAGVTLIAALLASRAGSLGAACAILAGGLVQLVLTYRSVRRHVVDVPFWRPLARPCLAFCVGAGHRYRVHVWLLGGRSAPILFCPLPLRSRLP